MGAALIAFRRRKELTVDESVLPRVLSTFDLTFLGVGSTFGAGVYVVTADIAKNVAGPGVVISFFIAAIAAILCGLCYAEFGARVPKAGSAYTYTYVTIGELAAFVIGWNLLLEYLIGAAAIARAWTGYIDSLSDNTVSKGLMHGVATWHTPGISKYPDFLSLAMCLLASGFLASGVRISSWVNTLMAFLNLIVILFVIVIGLMLAQTKNWTPFLPFGFSGVLAGSASAFFAFVGFDVIASSGEEVKNPGKAIPKAIVSSLLISFLGYCGLATALTLLVRYSDLEDDAALPQAFHRRGAKWAKYVIASGAVAGLTSSLVGSMFPVPRLLYSMANDGLIFSPFANINSYTKTPLFGSCFTGLISGWLALYFDLSTLVEMMSIGTLQAYTMVAICVLLLRYRTSPVGLITTDEGCEPIPSESLVSEKENIRLSPTKRTNMLVTYSTLILVVVSIGLCVLLIHFGGYVIHAQFWAVVVSFTLIGAFAISMTIIILQPQNKFDVPFSVPFVPVLPVASIFMNICLMVQLSSITWLRFLVWMIVGLSVYLFYGVQHSKIKT